ncbi:MAG: sugar ABC transporter ATP-binding protein [Christensenellaceae bacterium]|nr:sugar ABC transporter ATP-binding protein [Christensenellaceae bacterium]
MSNYILEMKNINKSFYGIPVLRNVNFGVEQGEVHVRLGENGAGKSTLMKILSGLYKADSGQILLDGKPVAIKSPSHSLSLGIGMVYQELSLIPHMSVVENIFIGHMPKTRLGFIDRKRAREETVKALERVGLKLDVQKAVSGFDLGTQQLIEIVRVLSRNAKLIILDAPTSSLSTVEVEKLFSAIRLLKQSGVSFIYITHKLDEVAEIGDKVTVLRDGNTIGQTMSDTVNITRDELVTRMVGRPLDEQYPKKPAVRDEILLEVRNLTDGRSLHDITFNVKRGEVLGIAGLVGAGTSELAAALFGLVKGVKGEIIYKGERFAPKNPHASIRQRIGLIPRDRRDGLALHMSVTTNICMAKQQGLSLCGFRLRKRETDTADRYIDMLRIDTDTGKKLVRDLSGGNQQKVAIAKWDCCETELFIMDDPTRGVDVGAKVEVYNLINNLVAKGAGVILISSDMPELLGMSDRIMIMRKGTVAAVSDISECSQQYILKLAAGSE